MLLVAGGHVGCAAALLWSVALGCAAAAVHASPWRRRQPLAGPAAAEALRDHHPRPDVLRRTGIARWYRVGSATIGARCPSLPSTSALHRAAAARAAAAPRRGGHAGAAGAGGGADRRRRAGAARRGRDAGVAGAVHRRCTRRSARITSAARCARIERAAPTPAERADAGEPLRRARADRVPGRRAGAHAARRQRGRADRDPAHRRELRGRQGHRTPRTSRAAPGSTPKRASPASAGTTAIAGHRTTYLAPFRHIDALRAGQPHPAGDALRRSSPTRSSVSEWSRPPTCAPRSRTSATAGWCCPPARRCSAPPNACSCSRDSLRTRARGAARQPAGRRGRGPIEAASDTDRDGRRRRRLPAVLEPLDPNLVSPLV